METEISKVIFVDANVLSFGTTLPGKNLGTNLLVGNLTDKDQIIELNVDSSSFNYKRKDLVTQAGPGCLPFPLLVEGRESLVNSEQKSESWWIENPISRETTRRITIKLGPRAEQNFVVVLKTPVALRKSSNMLSKINISLLT